MYLSKTKNIYVIIISIILTLCGGVLHAQNNSVREQNAFNLLDNIARETNRGSRIQETALNDISNIQGQYSSEYKIANTFDSIRIQIAPYIQWIMYLGLSLATIGLIYNGFMLVTSPVGGEGNEKIKTRIFNIIKGIIILTGFYVIIKLILIIISFVLS